MYITDSDRPHAVRLQANLTIGKLTQISYWCEKTYEHHRRWQLLPLYDRVIFSTEADRTLFVLRWSHLVKGCES